MSFQAYELRIFEINDKFDQTMILLIFYLLFELFKGCNELTFFLKQLTLIIVVASKTL